SPVRGGRNGSAALMVEPWSGADAQAGFDEFRARDPGVPKGDLPLRGRTERSETMNKATIGVFGVGLLAAVAVGASAVLTAGGESHLDAAKIGQAAGTKATTTKDGVVRLAWSRTDVKVTVDGLAFPPAAGLGTWAAFTPTKHGA